MGDGWDPARQDLFRCSCRAMLTRSGLLDGGNWRNLIFYGWEVTAIWCSLFLHRVNPRTFVNVPFDFAGNENRSVNKVPPRSWVALSLFLVCCCSNRAIFIAILVFQSCRLACRWQHLLGSFLGYFERYHQYPVSSSPKLKKYQVLTTYLHSSVP